MGQRIAFEYDIHYNSFTETESMKSWYNELGLIGWEIVHIREEISHIPHVTFEQWLTCKRINLEVV